MKLLLDQGLPRLTAALLRQAGVDAMHAAEIGLSNADDSVILEEGRRAERVVVTLDADFHTLMALSGARAPSVIRVRHEGLSSQGLALILQEVLQQCRSDLESGALVTVQQNRLRLRRLPLIR